MTDALPRALSQCVEGIPEPIANRDIQVMTVACCVLIVHLNE